MFIVKFLKIKIKLNFDIIIIFDLIILLIMRKYSIYFEQNK